MTTAARKMADMKVWAPAIIASVDAAPVLESDEHVLDLVPPAVERGVVRDWCLPVSRGHLTGTTL
jgi:hypothetical protein